MATNSSLFCKFIVVRSLDTKRIKYKESLGLSRLSFPADEMMIRRFIKPTNHKLTTI